MKKFHAHICLFKIVSKAQNKIKGFLTDRYEFSDETGKIRLNKEDCKLPSSLFSWTTDWQIDYELENGVDHDGWQYAFDVSDFTH